MNKNLVIRSAAALALALGTAAASATVITFGALPGANGSNFTSYTESGYTVAKTAGSGCVGTLFGNGVPSVFGGPTCDNGSTGSFSLTGGTFAFNGIDLAANGGALTYTFVGKLGAATLWTQTGTLAGPTATFVGITGSNASTFVNSVTMSFSTVGTSWNMDNINVAAVPEPSTLAMAGLGLAALVAWKRRQA